MFGQQQQQLLLAQADAGPPPPPSLPLPALQPQQSSLEPASSSSSSSAYGLQSARKYRSKRQRPCDLCRRRKTQCKISDVGESCELCKKLDRTCTFVLQPLKKERWRPLENPSSSSAAYGVALDGDGSATHHHHHHHHHDPSSLGDSMALEGDDFDDGDFPMGAGDVDSYALPPPPPPPEPHLDSSLAGLPSTAQFHAIDWSYLNFPISPIGNEYDFPVQPAGAASDTSPPSNAMLHAGQISPSQPRFDREERRQPESDRDARNGEDADRPHEDPPQVSPTKPHDATTAANNQSDWSNDFSLDERPGYSSLLIGPSNETDPFLLRHYVYDSRDTFRMFRLDWRKVADDASVPKRPSATAGSDVPAGLEDRIPASDIPVQFVMMDERICEDDLKLVERDFAGSNTEADDSALLQKIVPNDLGVRLLQLFFKFVQPSYPVLSPRMYDRFHLPEDNSFPVGLKAAVYALAIPFCFLDDELCVDKGYIQPSTDELWGIAHRGLMRNFRKSHLSLVQLGLLLLHRPPQNFAVADPPSFWALACSVLAAAQTMGLNLDPSQWRLPRPEIRLRRRLWWLVYVEHTWRALVLGRPSHINAANWDVSGPTADDLEADEYADLETGNFVQAQSPYFVALCDLSIIASEVLEELYSLRSMRQSPSLAVLLARAQPLRVRIQEWRQGLPADVLKPTKELLDDDGLDHCASLRLTYLSLELLVFRALLRPLTFRPGLEDQNNSEPRSTIFHNSRSCAKLVLELVAALKPKHFVNFWPSYARYQLSYMSNFAMLLFVQSPSIEAARENKSLVDKWRSTIRMQSRAWPVLKLAVMRLDAMNWKGLNQIVPLDSPAEKLLRSQQDQQQPRSQR